MPSYPVVVCLPPQFNDLNQELTARLAPFDAAVTVEPYRHYLRCTPAEFAAQTNLHIDRQTIADQTTATGEPTELTWTQVIEAYNLTPDAQTLPTVTVDERGAYWMGTDNPRARWRRWQVGGLAAGHFLAKSPASQLDLTNPRLINPRLEIASRFGTGLYCDGGPLRLLDLDGMRAVAGRSAAAMYQRWEEVTANTPPAAPTSEFFHRYVADPENYTIAQAVFDFMAQPRVRALLEHDHILRRYPRFTSNPEDFADVIDEFQQGKDEFISYNSAAAVHGYGLLTLDGQWLSPARPSAMTLPIETHEDRVAFLQAAEDYLASLTADTQLVIIEARI